MKTYIERMYCVIYNNGIVGVVITAVLILSINIIGGAYFGMRDCNDWFLPLVLTSFWVICCRITWKLTLAVALSQVIIGGFRALLLAAYPVCWVFNPNWMRVFPDELQYQSTVLEPSVVWLTYMILGKIGLMLLWRYINSLPGSICE